jgi:hypothetical protein
VATITRLQKNTGSGIHLHIVVPVARGYAGNAIEFVPDYKKLGKLVLASTVRGK